MTTPSVCCLFQIRRQAIKELPRFATGENILRVADILTQLLQTGNGCLQLIMLITFRVVKMFLQRASQTGVLIPSVPASVSVIPWESDLLVSLNSMLFSWFQCDSMPVLNKKPLRMTTEESGIFYSFRWYRRVQPSECSTYFYLQDRC